jgi:hypothetical protein
MNPYLGPLPVYVSMPIAQMLFICGRLNQESRIGMHELENI